MVVRIVIALFISLVSGACFLSGLTRLISSLLITFGVICGLFFGLVFLLPPGSERITFAVNAEGVSWPFFLVSLILIGMIAYLYLYKPKGGTTNTFEELGPIHRRKLGFGVLLYLVSLFLPVLLWFPSDSTVASGDKLQLETMLLVGVLIFIAGISAALYLIYGATKAGTRENPTLMSRFVPALFSVFHLDKVPALAAYLLVYSSEPELVFPEIAALALAAYIPVSVFFIKLTFAADERTR
jgi:hypothetical protein